MSFCRSNDDGFIKHDLVHSYGQKFKSELFHIRGKKKEEQNNINIEVFVLHRYNVYTSESTLTDAVYHRFGLHELILFFFLSLA